MRAIHSTTFADELFAKKRERKIVHHQQNEMVQVRYSTLEADPHLNLILKGGQQRCSTVSSFLRLSPSRSPLPGLGYM